MYSTSTILISHDKRDEKIAFEIKTFLEEIFSTVSVFVSGRDLVGGQTWIEEIKSRLKSSEVIISLLTTNSLDSNWVYFESGAGFTDDKTIPLLTDNLQPENVKPPLSLLQVRLFTETGIEMFIKDITKKLKLPREPKIHPSIKNLVERVEKLLRQENALKLRDLIPIKKVAPNATKQWIYEQNCLVHDFLIEEKNNISVDIYFYIDKTEIQLFDRSGSTEYIKNKMCKAGNFLPKPFSDYE